MAGMASEISGSAVIEVFDGAGNLWSGGPVLMRVIDGNQHQWKSDFFNVGRVRFAGLPIQNNLADNYTFIASADGHRQAGFFPVRLRQGVEPVVSLMLLPNRSQFNFARATWPALDQTWPEFKAFVGAGEEIRYGNAMEDNGGDALACLLNITTAMNQIHLSTGTAFDCLKRLFWDEHRAPMADRFFAFADESLLDEIRLALHQPNPIFAAASGILHRGATQSYKQTQFGEANVQITFHENDEAPEGQVLVECDIDYYKDPAAHLILEVAVNAFGEVTDPKAVYQLRWIAGRRAGIPEFDPLYTIERA